MEYFDILDRDGEPTGLTKGKGEPPGDGEYYLGVHAYIYNRNGEFLLQRRALTKAFRPGEWDIHLGHAQAGETGLEAMRREVREEVGLDCPASAYRFAGRVCWEEYRHFIDVFLLQWEFDLGGLVLQEEEVLGARTVSKEEMLALVERMDYRPAEYRKLIAGTITALAAL